MYKSCLVNENICLWHHDFNVVNKKIGMVLLKTISNVTDWCRLGTENEYMHAAVGKLLLNVAEQDLTLIQSRRIHRIKSLTV